MFLAFWAAETIVEQIIQIMLLPKVFDWANTAPIKDNGEVEEEEGEEEEGAAEEGEEDLAPAEEEAADEE